MSKIIERVHAAFPKIEKLNPMQEAAAAASPPALILLAPTGSGKTLAFGLRLLKGEKHGPALVLAPSRELVLQIAEVLRRLASGSKTVALYGGHNMADEVNSLTPAPDVIVATPGRMADHISRGSIDPRRFTRLVIDEYDKCLELGFEKEMKRIVGRMTRLESLTLTSATRLAELPSFLPKLPCETIDFLETKEAAPQPCPEVVEVASYLPDKLDTLVDLLRSAPVDRPTIVFVNHRESAVRVHQRLRREHLPAGLYHGALEQLDRENALEMFANGTTPILVSTDLASRGLDIAGVDAVIHYHLPPSEEVWTHRNGRTARQGAPGSVYVIISDKDNVPEYVQFSREQQPNPLQKEQWGQPARATLYFNLGKKNKVSRGDILGMLTGPGGLEGSDVGRIAVRDRSCLAAIPASKAAKTLAALEGTARVKGQRVRVSRLNS